jgi:hypothetical protein
MIKYYLITAIFALILMITLSACASQKFTYGTYTIMNDNTPSGAEKFNPDGNYVVTTTDGMIFDQGTFTIHGNTLTLLTSMHCYPGGKNANYTWKFSNDTLVLTDTGNDTCQDRMLDIKKTKFTLQK